MATMMAASSRSRVAEALARSLLADSLPDRWAHTQGVASRAADLAVTVSSGDRDVLVVAAWLHDIGYSPRLKVTGFHPLDGAIHLDAHGWPSRIAALVAHHSGAGFLAAARGMAGMLDGYPHEHSAVSDALTYADQTVGPRGQPMTLDQRIAEMLTRHGPHSLQTQVHAEREPYLRMVAARVEQRLTRETTPAE